ncbi:MAG: type II toxin-antitoxin system RelE/ParE family toxin [Cytophagales bacterium]|nr:type II toxin-antitoxin system RelE/ParE family toxin [Cytophagales bacterium]
MVEVIWTNNALLDLNEIGEYIAKDSPKYAEITVSKLYYKVEVLVEYPKIGRVVPEAERENLRELIEGNYRIIYEIAEDSIYIMSVHHSSQMLRI